MRKFISYTSVTAIALSAMVPLWFLLNNLQPLSPALYSFATLCIVGVIIFLRLFAHGFLLTIRDFFIKISNYKHFSLIALPSIALLAILVRFYFYWRFSYAPVSDPMTFYDAAQNIAGGHWLTGNSYPAFFPFLAAYDNMLGFTMKAINNPWLATILLNTVFDLGAALLAYIFTRKLLNPASKLPVLVFAVWLFSPFNILFSVLSLPIIIVNFFIITTILLIYLLGEKILANKTLPSVALAVLLGVTIGVGNCFRPIFIVAIVAIFLLFMYIFFTQKNRKSLLLLLASSFVLIVVLYSGIQRLDLTLIAKETGITPASNASGWSVYVGSNSSTNGTWNIIDQNKISQQFCKNDKSLEDCQQKLEKAGIERYRSYGIGGTISLFIRKLYVFSSDQSYVYNANYSIPGYTNSRTQKLLGLYTTLFIIALFYLSIQFFYQSAKLARLENEVTPIVLFIALLALGFFLSDMFVETAERYAQIMYPILILASVLSLETLRKRHSS